MAFRARRPRLGQHFLHSSSILDRIAREVGARLGPSELVVEIGPGTGALTRRLLGLGRRLIAVEIDRRLAAGLRAEFAGEPRLEVMEDDILEVDLERLIRERTSGRAVVAGNLPYYITAPILRLLFDSGDRISQAVLLMQKEVAARVAARPGSRDYGYLSVLCQAHSRPERLLIVPPGAFRPAPQVASALVRLAIEPRFVEWNVGNREAFLHFLQLCFHQKRKTLLNNLQSRFGRERLAELPEARLRAEQLSPERLAALWRCLSRSAPPESAGP
ncbi:MAG: ribosomal RNA small subunit methyltransferase A [Acidobacteria bacterium]|nr:ribosomal RNA small subunit methyltransferase A [Acidobacteriota bacterium]